MSNYQNLLLQQDGHTAIITINRPSKLNALNVQTFSELRTALDTLATDKNTWGIIITGAESKAFVAGADISEFSSFSPEQGRALSRNGHEVFNQIEQYSKPIVAAVNGFALGGGCELAMACHIRIASENAKFGQPEVNLGIIPGYGGTQRLIQLIGKSRAFELLMNAEMITAQQAIDYGLVTHVTTQGNLIQKAKELLEKIYEKSPMAVSKIIQAVNAYYAEGVDGFNFEIEAFASCCQTSEFEEGTKAFLDRRKAQFR